MAHFFSALQVAPRPAHEARRAAGDGSLLWARRSEAGSQADIFSREAFCTQYYGYTNEETALPDKYLKWANLGWDYTYPNPPYTADLYLSRTNKWVNGVLVREVGPWNIDDNYWDSNRRMWKDLPLGKPEPRRPTTTVTTAARTSLGARSPFLAAATSRRPSPAGWGWGTWRTPGSGCTSTASPKTRGAADDAESGGRATGAPP
ncbi:MAG: hypothetical protein K6T75_01055 [Acetobacteraceae bacterium]|nr:hypothetical protein [Acetobacteraceae bacterium]